MNDEGYRALQNELLENPDRGEVMPGCGGLRKIRFADPARSKGRRGGVRIIYLYIPEAFRIDFFDAYGKDEKNDLTPREKKWLAELSKQVKQEAVGAFNRSGGMK